jgi:hypothetical protein
MIDKIITDFVKKTSIEIKKKKNKDLIEKEIVEPVLKNFSERIYPYVSLLFIMYSINLVLIIIILILIISYNKKSNL